MINITQHKTKLFKLKKEMLKENLKKVTFPHEERTNPLYYIKKAK